MARFVIFDEGVRAVDLPQQEAIVGRSTRVDIPIRDRLLSRKHFTVSPLADDAPEQGAERYRLVDLKSANGTYVNGVKVDNYDLQYDDVIEVGSTVIVLLDTQTWSRGEGLPPLRNPLKAQELVQRLNRGDPGSGNGRQEETGSPRGGLPLVEEPHRAALSAGEAEFVDWARQRLATQPALMDLLLERVEQHLIQIVLRSVPEVRQAVGEAVERVLAGEATRGDRFQLRAALRSALGDALLPDDPTTEPSSVEPGHNESSEASDVSTPTPVDGDASE